MHQTLDKVLKVITTVAAFFLIYVIAFTTYYVDIEYGRNVLVDVCGFLIAFILIYIPFSLIFIRRTLREIISVVLGLAIFLSIAYVQKTFFPTFPPIIFRTFTLLYLLVFILTLNRSHLRCPHYKMFMTIATITALSLGYQLFKFFSVLN